MAVATVLVFGIVVLLLNCTICFFVCAIDGHPKLHSQKQDHLSLNEQYNMTHADNDAS
jgi:hypothetical protein